MLPGRLPDGMPNPDRLGSFIYFIGWFRRFPNTLTYKKLRIGRENGKKGLWKMDEMWTKCEKTVDGQGHL